MRAGEPWKNNACTSPTGEPRKDSACTSPTNRLFEFHESFIPIHFLIYFVKCHLDKNQSVTAV